MTITTSAIGIVVLIFILHTILTHLLNWMFREGVEEESGTTLFFAIILQILEFIMCIGLLQGYLSK